MQLQYFLVALLSATAVSAVKSKMLKNQIEDFGPYARLLPSNPKHMTSHKYTWVDKTAGTIPYGCNFVYGGGFNRLLHVGRVASGDDVIPAAIHHYGKGGTEFVRFIQNGTIQNQTDVQWLCGNGSKVAWVRVQDLSSSTLNDVNAIPVGYNSTTQSLTYSCLVHSFYSDQYPASVGTVTDGTCEFEARGQIVNTKDFTWWYTTEVLATIY